MVYFLAINGAKTDALTQFQVRELIERGEAEKSTLAWKQGMDEWRPLGEIQDFDLVFDPPPPPENTGGEGLENPRGKPVGKNGTAETRPQPWMRLFARGVDLILFFVVFQFAFAILFPGIVLQVAESFTAQVITLSVMILIWCAVEALFLSTWGYTLGKALFKVVVRNNDGEILSFKIALQRALLVWVKGLALMFVWITPIAMMIAHARLMIFGITTWDRDLRIRVTHGRPHQIQYVVAFAIYVAFAFMIYKAVELELERIRTEEEKEKKEGKDEPEGGDGGEGEKEGKLPSTHPEDLA